MSPSVDLHFMLKIPFDLKEKEHLLFERKTTVVQGHFVDGVSCKKNFIKNMLPPTFFSLSSNFLGKNAVSDFPKVNRVYEK